MFEIGRVCKKTAGSEKGKICVVVSKTKDDNFVIIDGNVRRRRCNITHLKPLQTVLEIKEDTSGLVIKNAMRKAGIEIEERVKLKERLRKAKELKKEEQKLEKTEEKEKETKEVKKARKEKKAKKKEPEVLK